MPRLIALISSRYVIWVVLAIPALRMVWPILVDRQIPPQFLVGSGEWAMRFLILTMALTPLQRVFRKSRLVYWLARRRRYFGVASFCYALIHVGFYVWVTFADWGAGALTWILFTATALYAWTGWLAFAVMLPLALTSNDVSRRQLGRWWKWVQRLTYLAALAAIVHWVLLANEWLTWVQIGILIVLEAIRIGLPLVRARLSGAGDRKGRLS